jgi:alpha/beta superfamily hydrolase
VPEEFPFFFGDGIFGVVHAPAGNGHPGWVICSPFGNERTNSHRLQVEWARYLASLGRWSLRFDYRGTGDSRGTFEDYTVHDYVNDIERAATELESVSGMPCGGVLGLRLGASLAAVFAATVQRKLDLALWEPVVNGRKYRNELLRTTMANEMVHSGGSHRSRDDYRRDLAEGRSIYVDGFAVARPMYDSLDTIDLITLGRPTSGRALIVQMRSGRGRAPAPAVANLFGIYSEGGAARLETAAVPPVWKETRTLRWQLDDLFSKTLGWFAETGPQPSSASAPLNMESEGHDNGSSSEIPVGFRVNGDRVWGILHKPTQPRKGVSNILFVPAGAACRSALFYPRLARDLAARGWNVLRFDARGLGDSHGDHGCDRLLEFYQKVEKGGLVLDTVAALDFMERKCGTRSVVLTGLCGGAVTSVFVAQADDRVAGIAPIDLPMTFEQNPGAIQQSLLNREVPWREVLSQRGSTLFLLKVRPVFHFFRALSRRLGLSMTGFFSRRAVSSPGGRDWYRAKIGEDVNLPMLAAMEGTLDRRIPVFCVFADGWNARYFDSALPGLHAPRTLPETLLSSHFIEGADHAFTMPNKTEELVATMLQWYDDPSIPWAQ